MSKIDTLASELGANSIKYLLDVPLKRYNTFGVGGSACILITPEDTQQIQKSVELCKAHCGDYFVLGRGSNLLISDSGICCPVILISDNLSDISIDSGNIITVSAGTKLSALCKFARDNKLSGLEFAYGIPGTVGGGVYMNAGAYGGELRDVILSVDYISDDGEIITLSNSELDFSYRHSFFCGKKHIILSARLGLRYGDKDSISEKMSDVMARRKDKQPLEYGSAGSTFKRPEGAFAGALIEQCGLKGARIGGAMVSEKHAGFIINYDNATATDIEQLIEKVQSVVKSETGYTLETEVLRIGGTG